MTDNYLIEFSVSVENIETNIGVVLYLSYIIINYAPYLLLVLCIVAG